MKLCKYCNKNIPSTNYNWTYCDRRECLNARKLVTQRKYRKLNKEFPYSTYDARHNWICKCPEMWLVPARFNYCAHCGAIPRCKYAQRKQIFRPEKHGVDVTRFIDNFLSRLNKATKKVLKKDN